MHVLVIASAISTTSATATMANVARADDVIVVSPRIEVTVTANDPADPWEDLAPVPCARVPFFGHATRAEPPTHAPRMAERRRPAFVPRGRREPDRPSTSRRKNAVTA